MKKQYHKSGQAMVEFMVGLVSILILMIALNQVASIVFTDLLSIASAREEVAANLVRGNVSSLGYNLSQSYDPSANFEAMKPAISAAGDYERFLTDYPSGRSDGFGFLWSNEDPLQNMTGSQKASSIKVQSPLYRKILGRDSIKIDNAVWMPPWDDLMQ